MAVWLLRAAAPAGTTSRVGLCSRMSASREAVPSFARARTRTLCLVALVVLTCSAPARAQQEEDPKAQEEPARDAQSAEENLQRAAEQVAHPEPAMEPR